MGLFSLCRIKFEEVILGSGRFGSLHSLSRPGFTIIPQIHSSAVKKPCMYCDYERIGAVNQFKLKFKFITGHQLLTISYHCYTDISFVCSKTFYLASRY